MDPSKLPRSPDDDIGEHPKDVVELNYEDIPIVEIPPGSEVVSFSIDDLGHDGSSHEGSNSTALY